MLSDIYFAKGDEKMQKEYEKIVWEKILSSNNYSKTDITIESTKSRLTSRYLCPVNIEPDSNEIKPDLYIIAGYSGCGKSLC